MSYRRKQQEKAINKRLYDETKTKYGSGAYYDNRKDRIVIYSLSSNSKMPKYLKRRNNKAVRRARGLYSNKLYKRLGEYLWEIL